MVVLKMSLSLVGSSWAYIVERTGANAGKLIASTRYAEWPALEGGARRAAAGPGSARHPSIMASAARLRAAGWAPAFLAPALAWSADRPQAAYEARARAYTAHTGSVDWLVVTGQDVSCLPTQYWVGGQCRACGSGRRPSAGLTQCVSCPTGHAGVDGRCAVCSAGTVPDVERQRCEVCPAGKTSAPASAACVDCPQYGGEVSRTGADGRCDECKPGFFALRALAAEEPCFRWGCHEMTPLLSVNDDFITLPLK